MTITQILLGGITALSSVVVYLYLQLQKRTDQLLEYAGVTNEHYKKFVELGQEMLAAVNEFRAEKSSQGSSN